MLYLQIAALLLALIAVWVIMAVKIALMVKVRRAWRFAPPALLLSPPLGCSSTACPLEGACYQHSSHVMHSLQ